MQAHVPQPQHICVATTSSMFGGRLGHVGRGTIREHESVQDSSLRWLSEQVRRWSIETSDRLNNLGRNRRQEGSGHETTGQSALH